MKTCAEHLPIELWIIIFCYLELHDLIKAFTNLNNYFDQLLASDYLLFNVKLKKNDNNYFRCSSNPYFSNLILNRIVCLQPSSLFRCNYISKFLTNHLNQLIRLQSLTIRIRSRETSSICKILQNLNLLRYLSIRCVPNQVLLEKILATPSLYSCQLEVWRPVSSINYNSGKTSNIQILCILFLNEPNLLIINLLLSRMPRLTKLEIPECGCLIDELNELFNQKLFIFEQLKTFKIAWNYSHIISNFLQHLHGIMPLLKRLYFSISQQIWIELLLTNLMYYWWSSIEQMQQIDIVIHYKEQIKTKSKTIEVNFPNKLNIFRQSLLAKSDQLNGYCKVKWNEKNFQTFNVTEIFIQKY